MVAYTAAPQESSAPSMKQAWTGGPHIYGFWWMETLLWYLRFDGPRAKKTWTAINSGQGNIPSG
jgi:hypothetical protein